ncbi:stage III sporulation protein AG [Thalassobacillus hwangdonensis]|uniref:Stage III sporulation protein AG n=1 Tax=Thalassobacillus hwangdonensis TaxID=546108 RepID=A0ABW3KXV3_9BACI
MGKWSDLFSSLKNEEGSKLNKKGYVVLVGLIGLLLLLVGNIFQGDPSSGEKVEHGAGQEESSNIPASKTISGENIGELEGHYEKQLTALLENIKGVSDVELMINLEATKEKVYDKNLIIGQQTTNEEDQNGGERSIEDFSREQQIVLIRQGDQELPLLIQTKKPNVKGVLVVAKGVDHMQVKQWVVEAVSRVLDVPSHRVSVMPKKG